MNLPENVQALLEQSRKGKVPLFVARWRGDHLVVAASVKKSCTSCGSDVAVSPASLAAADRVNKPNETPLICEVCLGGFCP